MRLYRNNGDGTFADVTHDVGLDVSFYGTGVAVGDYDNDGWVDLFVTAVGKNHLFHNDHGKFREMTDAAGVGGSPSQWSTSCAFVDYDNDGHLDLFVCNYVKWSKEIDLAQSFSYSESAGPTGRRQLRRGSLLPVPQQRRRHVHRRFRSGGHSGEEPGHGRSGR